ncbi:MAG: hypothetical protein JHC90_03515, partial [Ilumatobacteraceae bacterium]|nr:hypothetical protein [Ilumatobacteraceae bacterium]
MTTNVELTQELILDDHLLAAALARAAGEQLNTLRTTLFAQGSTQWHIKDTGDEVGHRFLMDALAHHRPNDAVLSEEGADNNKRLSANRVWII